MAVPPWASWYVQQLGGGAVATRAVEDSLRTQQGTSAAQRLSSQQSRWSVYREQGRAALAEAEQWRAARNERRRSAERGSFARQAASLRQMLPPRTSVASGLSDARIGRLQEVTWTPDCATRDCAVCMVAFEPGESVVSLPCSPLHVHHRSCISSWLSRQRTCPICRGVVAEPEPGPEPDA